MILNCKMFLASVLVVYSFMLVSLATSSPIEASLVNSESHDSSAAHAAASSSIGIAKFTYFLRCSRGECSLIESKPHSFDSFKSLEDQESSEETVSKRSSNSGSLSSLMKRFFTVNEDPVKLYKPDEIKCWSEDCKVQMARLSKRNKSGLGTLACVGDPYTNLGSRCVPIEGLYIGK